ncbi:dUMP phosphatase [compost metagenome]
MELLNIKPDEGVMIGDKLTTDILGSNTVGMRNMWINRHGIARTGEIEPAYEITSLRDIQPILDTIK